MPPAKGKRLSETPAVVRAVPATPTVGSAARPKGRATGTPPAVKPGCIDRSEVAEQADTLDVTLFNYWVLQSYLLTPIKRNEVLWERFFLCRRLQVRSRQAESG